MGLSRYFGVIEALASLARRATPADRSALLAHWGERTKTERLSAHLVPTFGFFSMISDDRDPAKTLIFTGLSDMSRSPKRLGTRRIHRVRRNGFYYG